MWLQISKLFRVENSLMYHLLDSIICNMHNLLTLKLGSQLRFSHGSYEAQVSCLETQFDVACLMSSLNQFFSDEQI